MNKIRNDFPPNVKKFFVNLQNYLDTDLYFYGSVNSPDYVQGKSDIDVAVLTGEVTNTNKKTLLHNFMSGDQEDFLYLNK